MNKKTFFVMLLVVGGVVGLATVQAATKTVPPQDPEKNGAIQILTTAELMKNLIDPEYEKLKDAVEVPAEGRKAIRALYIAAFNTAELSNLTFSRTEDDYMATEEWSQEAVRGRTLAVKLANSVRDRAEYPEIKANYLTLVRSCNDCHRLFMPGEIDEIVAPTSWGEIVDEDPDAFKFQ